MKYIILTNNPLAAKELGDGHNVVLKDMSYKEILAEARKLIYDGAVLLNHPLYGSVKPGETPYRSLLLQIRPGTAGVNAGASSNGSGVSGVNAGTSSNGSGASGVNAGTSSNGSGASGTNMGTASNGSGTSGANAGTASEGSGASGASANAASYAPFTAASTKPESDRESLRLIENALGAADKFIDKKRIADEQLLNDFQVVDLSLLKSAVAAADR